MIINKSSTFLSPRHFTLDPRQKPTISAFDGVSRDDVTTIASRIITE